MVVSRDTIPFGQGLLGDSAPVGTFFKRMSTQTERMEGFYLSSRVGKGERGVDEDVGDRHDDM